MNEEPFDMRDTVGEPGRLVRTVMSSFQQGERNVISTAVWTGKDFLDIVYLGEVYRTGEEAREGHRIIVEDVKNNPDKYTVEVYKNSSVTERE